MQFLIRDNLLRKGIISNGDYDNYLGYATKLHGAGYSYGSFDKEELINALEYAEDLFHKALSRK